MKTTDHIRLALQLSHHVAMKLTEDLDGAEMTRPTSRGGNHPLWTLGHLAFVEGTTREVFFGEENPVAHWAPLFAAGTQPSADAGDYPPFEEIRSTYRELREQNLALLDELGEEGLAKATKAPPPGFEDVMKTLGQTFLVIALHQMQHAGQISDARRVAGLGRVLFGPGERPAETEAVVGRS